MSEKKQCPLCGKLIDEDESFCEDCQNHMDNQYTTDLLDESEIVLNSDQSINEPEAEDEPNADTEMKEEFSSVRDEPDPSRKKGLSRGIIFVLVGAVLIVVIGLFSTLKIMETRKSAENEELFWINCVEENTPVSYAKYLVSYPQGKYAEDAEGRIRELREAETQAWENLKKSGDVNDFYAYLSENPNTPHINQIRFLMDSLSWVAAEKDNTEEAYKAYMENADLGNIRGDYKHIASERYNYLSRIVTLDGAALDSVRNDINHIFKVLSENEPKKMLRIFAPQAVYYAMDTTSTAIVEAIEARYKDDKILHINYTPEPKSVIVRRDSAGLLFVNVTVDKEVTYTTKVKIGKKSENKMETLTDTVKMELDADKQIRSMVKPEAKK